MESVGLGHGISESALSTIIIVIYLLNNSIPLISIDLGKWLARQVQVHGQSNNIESEL